LQEGDLSKEDSKGQLTQTMKETKFKTKPCLIFSSASSLLPYSGKPSEFRRTTQLLLRQTFNKPSRNLPTSLAPVKVTFQTSSIARR
jgi:hypothetical protein